MKLSKETYEQNIELGSNLAQKTSAEQMMWLVQHAKQLGRACTDRLEQIDAARCLVQACTGGEVEVKVVEALVQGWQATVEDPQVS